MKMPVDYEVPDDPDSGCMDAAYLRTCLGLRANSGEEPPPLPAAVRQAHYVMSRCLSALGARGNGMTPTQLATIVALAALEAKEPDPPGYSFLDESPQDGQKVVIHWRKKDLAAHFVGQTEDGRVVVLQDGKEVKMRADLVRHPEPNEFPDVASNINQAVEV